jgi:hypothetical protein
MKHLGWTLLIAGLIGLGLSQPSAGSGRSAPNPDDVNYLREQYALLQNLPPKRQQELRKLDTDLHALPKDTQDRLRRVLDRYNYWLANLPERERRRTIEAATGHERLKVIEEIKEREWVETLPKAYRAEYAAAPTAHERYELVRRWGEEQRLRRKEWEFYTNHRNDKDPPLVPGPFQKPDFMQQVELYARNLEAQLPPNERERLRRLIDAPVEQKEWFRLGWTLVELSEKHTLLPGPQDGPRNYDALPKSIRDKLEAADPQRFARKKGLPKELAMAQGRWPEFAIAVTDYARGHKIALPEPLGPVNKATMPPDLFSVIERLEKTLTTMQRERGDKSDQAVKDQIKLENAAGKWPEYPRTFMELARQYKIPVPGWVLPGNLQVWDRFRVNKPTKRFP